MASLWRVYIGGMTSHPLKTKIVTGATVYFLGDGSAQYVGYRSSSMSDEPFVWNRWRSFRMGVYGGLWLSPFLHVWYSSLDRFLIGRAIMAGRSTLLAVSKVAVDQAVAAPTNMLAFYTINELMEGHSLNDVQHTLREKFIPTMQALWLLWMPVQCVNLTIVPLQQRVLVVNFVGVGWSMFLSWHSNK
jgi:protein Mpv17